MGERPDNFELPPTPTQEQFERLAYWAKEVDVARTALEYRLGQYATIVAEIIEPHIRGLEDGS